MYISNEQRVAEIWKYHKVEKWNKYKTYPIKNVKSSVLLMTQDSGRVYSTQNYTWKYNIRSTLQNNTNMLNKYGPDIIKNAAMHVGRSLLRS